MGQVSLVKPIMEIKIWEKCKMQATNKFDSSHTWEKVHPGISGSRLLGCELKQLETDEKPNASG